MRYKVTLGLPMVMYDHRQGINAKEIKIAPGVYTMTLLGKKPFKNCKGPWIVINLTPIGLALGALNHFIKEDKTGKSSMTLIRE